MRYHHPPLCRQLLLRDLQDFWVEVFTTIERYKIWHHGKKRQQQYFFFCKLKIPERKRENSLVCLFFFLFVDNAYYFADEAIQDFRRKIVQVD